MQINLIELIGGTKARAKDVNDNNNILKSSIYELDDKIQLLKQATEDLKKKPTREMFDIYFSITTKAPTGAYPLWTGEKITHCKSIFPDFWKELIKRVGSGNVKSVTDAQYEESVEKYGQCAGFVIDELNGHVRLPKLTHFISSISELSDFGKEFNDQLQGHVHFHGKGTSTNGGWAAGDAFCMTGPAGVGFMNISDVNKQTYTTDGKNGEPRVGDTTRPKGVQLALYIQIANNSAEISEMNTNLIAEELDAATVALEAKKDAVLAEIGYSIPQISQNSTWVINGEDTGMPTQGAEGEPGEAGKDGQDGADGKDGATGTAATIAVGTVTTGAPGTSASVSNSGTPTAAVFNFEIPRGADGPTYNLPTAGPDTLGGVKVGAGLEIDSNGVLNAATSTTSGRVIGTVYWSQSKLTIDNPGAVPGWIGQYIVNYNEVNPTFYNWVKGRPELCVTRATYDSRMAEFTECDKYVIGEVPGSLRFPAYRKAIHSVRADEITGNYHDQMQEWTGVIEVYTSESPTNKASGGAKVRHVPGAGESYQSTATHPEYTIGPAINGAARTGVDTNVAHSRLYPWIIVSTSAVSASESQNAAYLGALNDKANLDLSNLSPTLDPVAQSRLTGLGFPNWNAGVTRASNTAYTVDVNGWIFFTGFYNASSGVRSCFLNVNGVDIWSVAATDYGRYQFVFPIKKGDTYKLSSTDTQIFYPSIGG